jgi:hypothetical protein
MCVSERLSVSFFQHKSTTMSGDLQIMKDVPINPGK